MCSPHTTNNLENTDRAVFVIFFSLLYNVKCVAFIFKASLQLHHCEWGSICSLCLWLTMISATKACCSPDQPAQYFHCLQLMYRSGYIKRGRIKTALEISYRHSCLESLGVVCLCALLSTQSHWQNFLNVVGPVSCSKCILTTCVLCNCFSKVVFTCFWFTVKSPNRCLLYFLYKRNIFLNEAIVLFALRIVPPFKRERGNSVRFSYMFVLFHSIHS